MVLLLFLMFGVFEPFVAQGLDLKYTPPCLENVKDLPGSGFTSCNDAPSAESITGYIANIYRFMIGISGILALGMIVAGAIYISVSPGSVDKQSEGRSMIMSAIFGVILIFGSYIILDTINPSLTILKEPSLTPIGALPASKGPVSCDSKNIYPVPKTRSDASVRAQLARYGILVNNPNCEDLCADINCTSLDYMPFPVIDKLIQIKTGCDAKYGNCSEVVTGGTEVAPHQTHGPDKPIVDLRWDVTLAQYVYNNASALGITAICTMPIDSGYRINCEFNEGLRHLHLQF